MIIRDLMSTALMTVKPGDTVERADLDMRLADIRHFPVVDDRHHLVGVVSDRDLLRAFGQMEAKTVTVKDVMSADVYSVNPDTSAADALEQMMERKIGSVPVVEEDGQLVGLVTETDFLEVARRALQGEELVR